MKLAERGSQLSNQLWLREIRKLTDSGHQTSILTTNFQAPMTTLAVSLFARWSQENFFRYRREHFSLDRLIEYGTEPIPDAISVVNPEWRKLDSQLRSRTGQRHRLVAQFGGLALSEDPAESEVQGFQQRKGHLQEEIQVLDSEIDNLKQLRKKTEHHIPVKSLPEEDRFTRLRTERKHFIDTLKMIAYRAESSMASLLREHLARGDDARALRRQIFDTEADLTPDLVANTLTVRLHHLTQAAHDQAIEPLLADLNTTHTVFPGTNLTPGLQTRIILSSPRSGGLTFIFTGVAPGSYVIRSNRGPGSPGPNPPLIAYTPVTISDRDLDGIAVPLGPGAEVTGIIKVEDDPQATRQSAAGQPAPLAPDQDFRSDTRLSVIALGTLSLQPRTTVRLSSAALYLKNSAST